MHPKEVRSLGRTQRITREPMHLKEVRSPGRTQRINKEYALGAQANSPAPFTGRGQGAGQFATRKFVIRKP